MTTAKIWRLLTGKVRRSFDTKVWLAEAQGKGLALACISRIVSRSKFGGYFEERIERNLFRSGHPKKITRNVASPRDIFLRGLEIFLRGVGHVPLAVPVLLHGHPFRALIHITPLYGSHFTIYHTQLYVHSRKYWILVSKCRKILRNFAKCVLSYAKCTIFLYKTELVTKFGSFWSEIRNEIWSISNEIQAKAKEGWGCIITTTVYKLGMHAKGVFGGRTNVEL